MLQLAVVRQSARTARINGVDSCVCKPVVATVGADCTLRLWNYQSKVTHQLQLLELSCSTCYCHAVNVMIVPVHCAALYKGD
jgi:hypothetical protein